MAKSRAKNKGGAVFPWPAFGVAAPWAMAAGLVVMCMGWLYCGPRPSFKTRSPTCRTRTTYARCKWRSLIPWAAERMASRQSSGIPPRRQACSKGRICPAPPRTRITNSGGWMTGIRNRSTSVCSASMKMGKPRPHSGRGKRFPPRTPLRSVWKRRAACPSPVRGRL